MNSVASFLQKHILVLSIFFLGMVAYAPSLSNALLWDDEQFIYNNVYVQTFDLANIFTTNTIAGAGEVSNYYRPLTTLSFAIDYQIWGTNPIGYHFTNTLLHCLSGVLLYGLLRSLGMSARAAAGVASIFLVHPVQTEAVVYASSRGDSHALFYTLLGLNAFSALLQKKYPAIGIYNIRAQLGSRSLKLLISLFFAASILAKEIALASILLYGVVAVTLWLHGRSKNNLKESLSVAAGIATVLALYAGLRLTLVSLQTAVNHFVGTPYGDSVWVRVATFTKVVLIYLGILVVPYNLHMERTTEVVLSLLSWYSLAVVLLASGMLYAAWVEYAKQKTAWILLGFLWFSAALLPVSGIVPLNDVMYEHWLYVPSIGFAIGAYGMASLLKNLTLGSWPTGTKTAFAVILCLYVGATILQNRIWSTPVRLYTNTLKYQETARIRNNLGMAYADQGQLEQAVEQYLRAIEISDVYPQTRYNLCRSYGALNLFEEAVTECTAAVTLDPSFHLAYPELAVLQLRMNNPAAALEFIEKVELLYPDSQVTKQLRALHNQASKRIQND